MPYFQSVKGQLVLCGIILAASVGCRSASNQLSTFEWAAPATKPIASAQTPAPPTVETAVANSDPQSSSDDTVNAEVAANEPPSKNDPLYGYYPKDDASDETDTSGPASRLGSFPSNSSGGCTSGCCSK